jgi:acetyl esterase/lipase
MKKIIILFSLQLFILAVTAQETSLPLYQGAIPKSKPTPATYVENNNKGRIGFVSAPTITPYLTEKGKGNGTGVIIFPGGGYSVLAIDKEGDSIAKAFNQIGVNAFVVKYRLPADEIMTDRTTGPLQDAQQAIATVRHNAAKWGVQKNKIGIIGFSAGGHLASTAGTHYTRVMIEKEDSSSLRPDFMILIYPVISMEKFIHAGSKKKLIGENASPELIKQYSNNYQVSATTPPTFILHATDDKVVPVQNSLMFYDALIAAGVKAEMHIYQAGGHGFGLNNTKATDKWFERCTGWLKENGF